MGSCNVRSTSFSTKFRITGIDVFEDSRSALLPLLAMVTFSLKLVNMDMIEVAIGDYITTMFLEKVVSGGVGVGGTGVNKAGDSLCGL